MNFPSAISAGLPGGATHLLGSIARAFAPPPAAAPSQAAAVPPPAPSPAPGAYTLTPAALRAALFGLGETASPANLALAEALTQLGLPLTTAMLAEARVALARAPSAPADAFALAKSLGLPATPGILHALGTATHGIAPARALPPDLMDWLGFAARAGDAPDALAAQLHLLAGQRLRSVEHSLLHEGGDTDIARHTRTLLLRLAAGTADPQIAAGADTLAAHLEGQQLINLSAHAEQQAAHAAGQATPAAAAPLYVAVPLLLPGEQTMLEMSVQPWSAEQEAEAGSDAPYLQATVRLATTRLGPVQAALVGTLSGALVCRLGAERPATLRLLRRGEASLAAAFAAQGWLCPQVCCTDSPDWRPLWQGGAALAAPRARVDWQA